MNYEVPRTRPRSKKQDEALGKVRNRSYHSTMKQNKKPANSLLAITRETEANKYHTGRLIIARIKSGGIEASYITITHMISLLLHSTLGCTLGLM